MRALPRTLLANLRDDLNLRVQRSMHRTFICDLQQLRPLHFVEVAGYANLALESIDLAFLRFTIRAVLCMDL